MRAECIYLYAASAGSPPYIYHSIITAARCRLLFVGAMNRKKNYRCHSTVQHTSSKPHNAHQPVDHHVTRMLCENDTWLYNIPIPTTVHIGCGARTEVVDVVHRGAAALPDPAWLKSIGSVWFISHAEHRPTTRRIPCANTNTYIHPYTNLRY